MKAAVYVKSRSGKVLEIRDVEQPAPKEKELVIRVRAASVNPLDWRLKSERPGVDVAGEVFLAGNDVTRFKPGDAVFGLGKGTFAEYAAVAEDKLVAKPQTISFEQAAAVPIAGLTALQGLRDKGHLRPGQKILINGASGGVGTFAVQIAKWIGAQVTGVCGTGHVDLVRSLGANRVVDYTREDFTAQGNRFDLLLDNAANRRLSEMSRILGPGGKCVVAGAPKEFWPMLTRILHVLCKPRFGFFIAKMNAADLTSLGTLIASRKITPVIDRQYALAETGAAIAYVEEGHARGKVILTLT
jgi:NADPH:quinone reductase-like Zn-dependent oxidoreductase